LFDDLPLHILDCTAEERISEGGMPSLGFRSCVELQVAGI
jgi:hypothetical protein